MVISLYTLVGDLCMVVVDIHQLVGDPYMVVVDMQRLVGNLCMVFIDLVLDICRVLYTCIGLLDICVGLNK